MAKSVRLSTLERLIAVVSPQAAVNRQAARLKLAGITRARMLYDGATVGHRAGGWRPTNADANNEVRLGGARLRENARDMVRNNPYAARAKAAIAGNVVGTGIIPTILTKTERVIAQLEELLIEHFDTPYCDAAGSTNLYGLQNQVMGTVVESGEALVRYRPRSGPDYRDLPLPFQLQVLEPDYFDILKDGPQANGNWCVQGIEFTKGGRIVGYWLFDEHPGNTTFYRTAKSSLVPADMIAHVFRPDRPGQVRGVSWYAPVILRMRDFNDFTDAQLMRQKIAACFAAFIVGDSDETTLIDDEESPSGLGLESLEPGMIKRLRNGESVEFASPPGVAQFAEYSAITLHEIAAGLGISYEALTGDLRGVNFSSGRMGWLEFQRNIESWRHTMLEPQLLNRLGDWFLDAARLKGFGYIGKNVKVKWTHPRREMISPKDEIPYMKEAVRDGFMTRSEVIRKQGYDPIKVDEEIAEDNKRADKLGLVFDTDPRQRTAVGAAVTLPTEGDESSNSDKDDSSDDSPDSKPSSVKKAA